MLFEPVYPRCRRGPEILTLFGFRLLVRKRPLLLLCAGTRRHFNTYRMYVVHFGYPVRRE